MYTKTNDCLLQFSTAKADLTAMPAMSSVCFDLFLSFLRCCYFCCHSLRHCDTYVQMCVHLLFYNGVNNIKSSFMGVHIEIGTDTKHEFDTSVEFQFVFIFSPLFYFAFFISLHSPRWECMFAQYALCVDIASRMKETIRKCNEKLSLRLFNSVHMHCELWVRLSVEMCHKNKMPWPNWTL